jgi:hypothetical protein
VISGPGDSAALSLTGNYALSGQFVTGTLSQDGTLDIVSGTTLSTVSATLNNGDTNVNGVGAALLVSGTLAIGGELALSGSADVRAASVVLTTYGAEISIDSSSVFEVGTTMPVQCFPVSATSSVLSSIMARSSLLPTTTSASAATFPARVRWRSAAARTSMSIR